MQLERLKGDELQQLFQAMLSLQTVEECYAFFNDLCTVSEVKALTQRLEVARMLREGHTYFDIQDETNASTATISRVKTCLNYGSSGYDMVLERMAAGEDRK